jgi:hypothetical protein
MQGRLERIADSLDDILPIVLSLALIGVVILGLIFFALLCKWFSGLVI